MILTSVRVQCCITSSIETDGIRTIRDGEPRTVTSVDFHANPELGPLELRINTWVVLAKMGRRAFVLSVALRPGTETVGLLGTGAQDGHLDFHTAPELCRSARDKLFICNPPTPTHPPTHPRPRLILAVMERTERAIHMYRPTLPLLPPPPPPIRPPPRPSLNRT